MWGNRERTLNATSKKLNQYIAKFNLSEVALLYHLHHPRFSSLRCGEPGVLWGLSEAVYPLRGIFSACSARDNPT